MQFDFNLGNINSKYLYPIWEERDNYEIVKYSNNSNLCFVYFSSNGVYFPNEVDVFNKMIINENRFEWKHLNNTVNSKIGKAIFIRDVFKNFYITGINSNINSIDNLLDFLRKETEGYDVYTIGSSAGGYMAMLAGSLLQVKRIYSFSGQFDISSEDVSSYPLIELMRKQIVMLVVNVLL